jgi:hypothetical protein
VALSPSAARQRGLEVAVVSVRAAAPWDAAAPCRPEPETGRPAHEGAVAGTQPNEQRLHEGAAAPCLPRADPVRKHIVPAIGQVYHSNRSGRRHPQAPSPGCSCRPSMSGMRFSAGSPVRGSTRRTAGLDAATQNVRWYDGTPLAAADVKFTPGVLRRARKYRATPRHPAAAWQAPLTVAARLFDGNRRRRAWNRRALRLCRALRKPRSGAAAATPVLRVDANDVHVSCHYR